MKATLRIKAKKFSFKDRGCVALVGGKRVNITVNFYTFLQECGPISVSAKKLEGFRTATLVRKGKDFLCYRVAGSRVSLCPGLVRKYFGRIQNKFYWKKVRR